ncbi:hypothetical protein JYU34_012766 [Plutella xylostella]|uniref:Uncharacterized protein n=1 Tax=Plutella xylostella TaxID=51655 RepID=A0ABQ7QDF3_PLUXY|nr:hypothetical protein JYU34_012766 [Plutella xylostella]
MVLQREQIQCDSEKAEAMKMVAAAVNTQTAVNEGHNARLMAFIEAEKETRSQSWARSWAHQKISLSI